MAGQTECDLRDREYQVIYVTKNLWEALWGCQGRVRYLWVDVLCINQADEVEKTAQVREMRSIFGGAKRVVCWLGKGQSRVRTAFNVFWSVYHIMEVGNHGDWTSPIDKIHDRFLRDDEAIAAVLDIIRYPWFQRVWVLQELLAAWESVFWCGDASIDTKVLLHFGWYTRMMPLAVRRKFEAQANDASFENWIANIQAFHTFKSNEVEDGKIAMPMSTLLRRTQLFKATDSRDKIIAMVALNASVVGTELVDYSKTYPEVIFNLASSMLGYRRGSSLRSEYALDYFHFAGCSSSSAGVPSWVPTWQEHIESTDHEIIGQFPLLSDNLQSGWHQINEDRVSLPCKSKLWPSSVYSHCRSVLAESQHPWQPLCSSIASHACASCDQPHDIAGISSEFDKLS